MAARGIDSPACLSWGEISTVCASVLVQLPQPRTEVVRNLPERSNQHAAGHDLRQAVSLKSRNKLAALAKTPVELPENRHGSRLLLGTR